jgi:hypothetical protein
MSPHETVASSPQTDTFPLNHQMILIDASQSIPTSPHPTQVFALNHQPAVELRLSIRLESSNHFKPLLHLSPRRNDTIPPLTFPHTHARKSPKVKIDDAVQMAAIILEL